MNLLQLLATGAPTPATNIEDVFSTYLTTGTGAELTVTTNVDLSTNGGMVWSKSRSAATGHRLTDTIRGATKELASELTAAEATAAQGVKSFSTTGFVLGTDTDYNDSTGSATYVHWTFRKAAKFFDVVTYTGNGANRTIAHNLGVAPGMIILRSTDNVDDWTVWHNALANTEYLQLNTTAAKVTGATTYWNSTSPTLTDFSLGTSPATNGNTKNYIAYLFAHDTSATGLIQCGGFTASSGATVTLGWEPQYVMIKQSGAVSNWEIFDTMRGFPVGGAPKQLYPNLSSAEGSNNRGGPTSTGLAFNAGLSDGTYIYLAIRRGPMAQPTVGTQVFAPTAYNGNSGTQTISAGFPVDMSIIKLRTGRADAMWGTLDRLRGWPNKELYLNETTAEAGQNWQAVHLDNSTGTKLVGTANYAYFNDSTGGYSYVNYAFRRYPGVFDMVAYTGDGQSTQTVTHNLTVAPEMVILKRRGAIGNWWVRTDALTSIDYYLELSTTAAQTSGGGTSLWGNTTPTATAFTVGNGSSVNTNAATYAAYLFATKAGISKVGSYTGNGTNQTINCGFSAGARFVLVKATSTTGNWIVGDSTRGLVAGNDPYLLLNTTGAEVTGEDWLDPDNSGFVVNETTAAANTNGVTYIYLAFS